MKQQRLICTRSGLKSFPIHILVLGAIASLRLAAMSVALTPSTPSPAPLGTPITWSAAVSDADAGTLTYSFRAGPRSGVLHTVVDFGPNSTLDWTTIQREGDYEMEDSAKNTATGDVAAASLIFTFSSLVTGAAPVVTPTANPLVFIYSAPPCAAGGRMRVAFQPADGLVQNTPWEDCHPRHSMNVYLAGMRAETQFTAHQVVDTGSEIANGPNLSFATPAITVKSPALTLLNPAKTPAIDGLLVSEQLTAMGMHGINGFHHEARKLANGDYLVLANSERILTGQQGPGDVDVIGDTILVLNGNLQVAWAWDSFDHLDTARAAILGEICSGTNGGCPPWHLAPAANDWLHGNSLQLTPDGNILYSSRHQDWLIKIDYENGAGSGKVLWRLGKDGDFQITSTDPNPWFSHQHDANFEANGRSLTVFDDGNTRNQTDPSAHSRGQALVVDEQNMTARLILNADVGTYSSAVGSAQRLPNGDYHFDSGFIEDPSGNGNLLSQSVEVTATGNTVYAIQFGAIEYRSFRMRDLYTAP